MRFFLLILVTFFYPISVRANSIKNLIEYANQGNVVAQYNLGLKYYQGDCVAQNYEEAFKWWK